MRQNPTDTDLPSSQLSDQQPRSAGVQALHPQSCAQQHVPHAGRLIGMYLLFKVSGMRLEPVLCAISSPFVLHFAYGSGSNWILHCPLSTWKV